MGLRFLGFYGKVLLNFCAHAQTMKFKRKQVNMIQAVNVRLQFGGRVLFDDVNIKFTAGNCYGIIGANGAGKSTFLKVLSGELEPNKGDVVIEKNKRLSVLKQNQNEFDNETVLRTVLLGHKRLIHIMDEKEVLYSKPDFSDADGIKAAELENEFLELDGWGAESAAQQMLSQIGISDEHHNKLLSEMEPKQKVKVLLAQALFGNPDILILDEPTNNLDAKTIMWLENFLLDFENTVIIVSHNRHFLNKVCTHTCDVDFGKINMFVGNYDFWYESSQLIQRQMRESNKKTETRAKELQDFIARFSANASKSKQATSRKRELEKLTIEDIKPSNRKYPYIDFKYDREVGNDILVVNNLSKEGAFKNVSFVVHRDDKIAFFSEKASVISALFDVLSGEVEPTSGSFKYGITITKSYLPQNYDNYFDGCKENLVNWLGQFSKERDVTFLRSWLGRMLFSGEEALKEARVLSGGEKVRCMLSKTMLSGANFLLLDEPTNHLDLEAITSLNKGMQNFKGNMLFASQDFEIVQTVANRIIEIEPNGTKVFDKAVSYEEYLEQKQ